MTVITPGRDGWRANGTVAEISPIIHPPVAAANDISTEQSLP
jgi:hypothetical protein